MHDSHIHLTTQPLFDYKDQALESFVQNEGKYLLNCAYNIESSVQVIEIFQKYKNKYPHLIQNALGIHPEEFHPENKTQNVQNQIEQLKDIIRENIKNIHAIGETGLEYYNLLNRNDIDFEKREEAIENQKTSFREHIKIALEYNLPMTIHSRDEKNSDICTKDLINIIATEGKVSLKGAMHSYAGDEKFLQDILDLNLYIGFNAIITYKNGENVRELLKKTPIDRILLETDAPFLPTDSVRKNKKATIRFGQPTDIMEIAKTVADIKNLKQEEVFKITNENYEHLFLN